MRMKRGMPFPGIKECEEAGALVFHAGTAKSGDAFVTNGGRVLGVVYCAQTLPKAIEKAYVAMDSIVFEKKHVRRDIGVKA